MWGRARIGAYQHPCSGPGHLHCREPTSISASVVSHPASASIGNRCTERRSLDYLQRFAADETEKWREVIRAANIKPE